MSMETTIPDNPLAALRRLVPQRPRRAHPCELCSAELPPEHEHVIDVRNRRLLCACQACAVLLSDGRDSYRRVKRRAARLPGFVLSDARWDSLLLPINLAFFYFSSAAGRVIAVYPSPAGAMESLLELKTWDEVLSDNPLFAKLEPDVEALLVNRVGQSRDYYRISIDHCYQLIGLIRLHWRGLSGGSEVWNQIRAFFEHLQPGEHELSNV